MYEFLSYHYIILSSLTYQLKSNVVSLDSHIGQYAVICEKQRQEVITNNQYVMQSKEKQSHGKLSYLKLILILMFCCISKDSTVEEEAKRLWGEEHGAWDF